MFPDLLWRWNPSGCLGETEASLSPRFTVFIIGAEIRKLPRLQTAAPVLCGRESLYVCLVFLTLTSSFRLCRPFQGLIPKPGMNRVWFLSMVSAQRSDINTMFLLILSTSASHFTEEGLRLHKWWARRFIPSWFWGALLWTPSLTDSDSDRWWRYQPHGGEGGPPRASQRAVQQEIR